MNHFKKIVLDSSSIHFAKHSNLRTLEEIQAIVKNQFSDSKLSSLPKDNEFYHNHLREVQDELNNKEYVHKIVTQIFNDLNQYVEYEEFLVQSNLYLRATRPQDNITEEAIGWHRESFYGPNMEDSINVWTPILNVTEFNTLRYIPGSQQIPDNQIILNSKVSELTKKGSDRNKVGLLYAPKEIVSGVDLSKNEAMLVPEGCSSVFSGNLIHGAAINYDKKIRFSVDFRIIAKKNYKIEAAKTFHAASGKPYFVEFDKC